MTSFTKTLGIRRLVDSLRHRPVREVLKTGRIDRPLPDDPGFDRFMELSERRRKIWILGAVLAGLLAALGYALTHPAEDRFAPSLQPHDIRVSDPSLVTPK